MNKSSLALPETYPVTSHTDYVGVVSTFVVIHGAKEHGLAYVKKAVQKGASKIVMHHDLVIDDDLQSFLDNSSVEVQRVSNPRQFIAQASAEAWNYPASSLKLIGVTGTKGKTSTVYLLYFLLRLSGRKVALLSTAEKLIDGHEIDLDLTTPLPEHLHAFFDLCKKQGVEYVVMEVSAQALSLHRVEGLEFAAGMFTNFSLEHLEFYDSLESYFAAKKKLIHQVVDHSNMFINFDDQHGKILLDEYKGCLSYSLQSPEADFYASSSIHPNHLVLKLIKDNQTLEFSAPLIGKFNASNLLGVLAVLDKLGISFEKNLPHVAQLDQIPGRMEKYQLKNGAYCFIDYAHNPSSFEAVLSTLASMTDDLIVVFGAGGCRDKSKRPMMGAVAEQYAQTVILTSDNPRDEDPHAIVQDILQGFKKPSGPHVIRELNRTKSIELAYAISRKNSIIAILGKGRDEYQIVGGLTFPFKERAIIKPFVI